METGSKTLRRRGLRAAVVCHVEGSLLRSSSCFPYFMVVALEAGSFLRGLVLLLLYPLLSLLTEELGIRAMTIIAFSGIHVSSFREGNTVLPKHLLEDVGREGFKVLMAGKKKVCVSRMPKVMVEDFLRKYLQVEVVVAKEMKVIGGYFTGFMEEKMVEKDLLGDVSDDEDETLGFYCESDAPLHPLFSRCKEIITATESEKATWQPLPRDDYPEPLIFHDGRLSFRPTPAATTAMFVFLPFSVLLVVLRALLFLLLPFGVSTAALAFTGMHNRIVGSTPTPAKPGQRLFFACNHRTQVDPIWVSGALGRHVISLVYGLSAANRLLSPIRTVLLKRIKEDDRKIMMEELARGDVVLCPEGTTCREPFVLRFSPLFAELVNEVIPVALSCYPSMFHGTTVNGRKPLDPFVLLANPHIYFSGEFLESIPAGTERCSRETANKVQAAIARALGFRCNALTRKDKYQCLAGTDGVYSYKP